MSEFIQERENIMNNDMEAYIKVKDVMSSPVVTTNRNESINSIGALMGSKSIGSVIVLDDNSNPIGIITERDIVARIVSKNLSPKDVRAEEIMSKPLHTIDPEATISEAAKIMRHFDIRRLIVIEKSELVGIVSSDDIVKITPELITIISEESTIGMTHPIPRKKGLSGQCESCDQWSDNLKEHNGLFLCEECIPEL